MSLLAMVRGDTATFTITVTNQDGTPFDLTSATLWFSVRSAPGAVGYIFQKKTPSSGITVATPTTGVAVISIDNADTSGLSPSEQRLVWDCQLKTSGGSIFTINRGDLIVSADITTETT